MQAITFSSIFAILTACSPPLGSRLALRINALLYKNFKRMVETMRIELTTPCLQGRCSFQLSYVPIFIFMRVQFSTRTSHHLYCVLRCFFQLRWVHRAGRSHQIIGPIQPQYESYRRRGILYSISNSDAITCFNKRRLFLLLRLFDHILHYLS